MSPEISPFTLAAKTAELTLEATQFITIRIYGLIIRLVNQVEGTPEEKRAQKALKQKSHDRA